VARSAPIGCCFGTDFPYLYGPKLRRCVTYIEDAGLSAADTAAILGGNAQALLGLTASE